MQYNPPTLLAKHASIGTTSQATAICPAKYSHMSMSSFIAPLAMKMRLVSCNRMRGASTATKSMSIFRI